MFLTFKSQPSESLQRGLVCPLAAESKTTVKSRSQITRVSEAGQLHVHPVCLTAQAAQDTDKHPLFMMNALLVWTLEVYFTTTKTD